MNPGPTESWSVQRGGDGVYYREDETTRNHVTSGKQTMTGCQDKEIKGKAIWREGRRAASQDKRAGSAPHRYSLSLNRS